LVGVIEGIPAGLELDLERVNVELARRQRGYGRGGRMKIERDEAELVSGTRAGRTIGAPIALRIANADHTIEQLPVPTDPRPGHADLAGCQKLGERDPRAVLERASARETAARVALAGVARQVLERFGVELFAHVVSLGGERVRADAWEAAGAGRVELRDASDFLSLDPEADGRMRARVDAAREEGDSLGGAYEVRALGLPPGLGSHASGPERLTARIGAALLSIPAMKAVEFGLGTGAAERPGSEYHDPIVQRPDARYGRFGRASNNAGGLEGGMTTGEPVVVRVTMKPIPTLRRGVPTVDFETYETVQSTYQRSDVTSVPAASVVGEALMALALTEAFLDKFGGDTMDEVAGAVARYAERLRDV